MISTLLLILAAPKVTLDVVYADINGEKLAMDIYQPAGESAALRPGVIVIHGGAWMSGTRKDMAPLAEAMAGEGMVAASVSYRLAPKHKWPAMLDDVQAAVKFLRQNGAKYGADPKRIGASGASAGGHLAVFLGVIDDRERKVKAVLDIFGPTDLTDRNDFPPGPLTNMLALQLFGKKPEDAEAAARSASPLFLVSRDDAPVFIVHGLSDSLVRPHQSRVLEQRLKEHGVRVESAYIEGMGHAVDSKNPKVMEAMARGIKWLRAQLSN